MTAFNSPLDKYSVTERLFTLIDDLSTDLQFILYKQLIKDNVTTQLFKLIIDMSDEKKIQLLEKAGEMPIEEEPVKTINLDENESFMRENLRKICLIPVNCKIADTSFKSYIINISMDGVFIETKDPFPVGHNMEMAFKLPNYPKTLEIKGQVTRSGLQGISVIFFDRSQAQEEIIRAYIANKN
jgi:Tfp pilus assembly protein PilZ